MDEKRKPARRRVLKEGKIVFADGLRVIDCTIRDLSTSGARLLIANTVGRARHLHPLREILRPALSRHRRLAPEPTRVGVQFEGPPTSINDAANKRYARLKF